MKQGTYVGPHTHLIGETALLRLKDDGTVLAQFDGNPAEFKHYNKGVGQGLKHPVTGDLLLFGWHPFAAQDFKVY